MQTWTADRERLQRFVSLLDQEPNLAPFMGHVSNALGMVDSGMTNAETMAALLDGLAWRWFQTLEPPAEFQVLEITCPLDRPHIMPAYFRYLIHLAHQVQEPPNGG
jgi:hypothetical protein